MNLRFFRTFLIILIAEFFIAHPITRGAEIQQFEGKGLFAKILPKEIIFPKEIDQHIISFSSPGKRELLRGVSTQAKNIVEEISSSELDNLLQKSPVEFKIRAYLWDNKKIFFSPKLKKIEKKAISNLLFENLPILFFGNKKFLQSNKHEQFKDYKKYLKKIHKISVKAIAQNDINGSDTPQIFILEKKGKEPILYAEIPIEFIIQEKSLVTLFPQDKTYRANIRVIVHDQTVVISNEVFNNFIEKIATLNCFSKIQFHFEQLWQRDRENLFVKKNNGLLAISAKFNKITALFLPDELYYRIGKSYEVPIYNSFGIDHETFRRINYYTEGHFIPSNNKWRAYSKNKWYAYYMTILENTFADWIERNQDPNIMVDRDMQKVLAKLSWYINVESYQKDGEQPPDEFFESLRNNLKEIIIFFGPKNFCYFLKKKNLYSQSQRKQFLRKLLEYDHTNAPAVDCFINIFEEILNNYKEDTTDLFTGVRLYEHLVNNIHTESSVFSKIKNHKIAVFSALGVSALIGFLTKRTWLPPVKKLVNQLKSRKTHSGKII